jgi:threonine/homoserine/homoserine lactone efflux protein
LVKVLVAEILPLALVVTISPINIIPIILLLFTKRPLVNSSLFVAGFIAGVAGVLVACIAIAEAVNLSPSSGHSTWVAWLKLVLGVYLQCKSSVVGPELVRKEPCRSGWTGSQRLGPGKSLGAGLALGAGNPKNVVVGLAAAATIASFTLSNGQLVATIAIYVLVAVLGIAAPILVTVFLGDRSREVPDGWKAWLGQNNATVMSVLFLVFGVVLIAQAIGAS